MSLAANLLHKTTEFLDPHLSLVILEGIEEKKALDESIIAQEKIQVLSRTRIYDYFLEDLNKLKSKISAEEITSLTQNAENEKKEAARNLAIYKKYSENFINNVVEDKEKYAELEKEKFTKAAYTKIFKSWDIFTKEELENSVKYARALYDIGQYSESNKILNCLLSLVEDEEQIINVLWGKLTSEILTESINEAVDTLKLLRDKLEKDRAGVSHMQVLANRVSLLHTALYLFLNLRYSEESLEALIDLFTRDNYLSAIQDGAPHLVRYLIGALLLWKNYPKFDINKVNNLLPNFKPEVCSYSDCLNRFIIALLQEFDFKKAQVIIKDFKKDLENDYFLGDRIKDIVNNAQKVFFEVYCKIYRKIEIKTVSDYLGVSKEEAEIWIVNLIRSTNTEAKVDPEQGVIYLTTPQHSVYEQVFNKTKDLVPRTNILINNISRILKNDE
jgi:translation initiation factor 3 subunit E